MNLFQWPSEWWKHLNKISCSSFIIPPFSMFPSFPSSLISFNTLLKTPKENQFCECLSTKRLQKVNATILFLADKQIWNEKRRVTIYTFEVLYQIFVNCTTNKIFWKHYEEIHDILYIISWFTLHIQG